MTVTAVGSALTSALSTLASDAMTVVGNVLPVVLPVMGALVVVTIGIKLFKRIASRG